MKQVYKKDNGLMDIPRKESPIYKVKNFLKDIYPTLKENKVILAGGAITSLYTDKYVNDWDLYLPNAELKIDLIESLTKHLYTIVHTSKKAIALERKEREDSSIDAKKIHIIEGFYQTPEEVLNSYDFTVVKGAYSFTEDIFTLHPKFKIHNKKKILENSEFGKRSYRNTFLRYCKYLDKGYKAAFMDILKIQIVITAMPKEEFLEGEEYYEMSIASSKEGALNYLNDLLSKGGEWIELS
jgi:hypothetical protein